VYNTHCEQRRHHQKTESRWVGRRRHTGQPSPIQTPIKAGARHGESSNQRPQTRYAGFDIETSGTKGKEKMMRYPIAVEQGDAKHDCGVVVPDLPGCFSAGATLDEAIQNANEAILLHIDGLLEDGEPIPTPSTVEHYAKKRTYKGWIWAIAEIDMSQLDDSAERVNITVPKRALRIIDEAAKRDGESRSGFLVKSAMMAAKAAHGAV
jgi:predicted RNase H-like HicB family nuclease